MSKKKTKPAEGAAPPIPTDDDAPPPVPPTDDDAARVAELARITLNTAEQRAARTGTVPDNEEIRRLALASRQQEREMNAAADRITPTLPSIRSRTYDAARRFLRAFFMKPGFPTIVYWRGHWYTFHHGAWKQQSENDIDKFIRERLVHCMVEDSEGRAQNFQNTPQEFGYMKDQIKFLCKAIDDRDAPLRFVPSTNDTDGIGHWESVDSDGPCVLARNGLVDWVAWTCDVKGHYFAPYTADWEFVAEPGEPQLFLSHLEQQGIVGEDRDTLQEFGGYVASNNNKIQRALMLLGPERSGKGTIIQNLINCIGEGANASPTLSELSQPHGLGELVDKKLCSIGDAATPSRQETINAVTRIKGIVGRDRMRINEKYEKAFTLRLPVRLLIATNELPRLFGGQRALPARFLFLTTRETLDSTEQDPDWYDKINAETAAIARWYGRGYMRLMKNGHFTESAASKAIIEEMYHDTTPVAEFADSYLKCEPDAKLLNTDLWETYLVHCEIVGIKDPWKMPDLVKNLHTHYRRKVVSAMSNGVRFQRNVRLLTKDERNQLGKDEEPPQGVPKDDIPKAPF